MFSVRRTAHTSPTSAAVRRWWRNDLRSVRLCVSWEQRVLTRILFIEIFALWTATHRPQHVAGQHFQFHHINIIIIIIEKVSVGGENAQILWALLLKSVEDASASLVLVHEPTSHRCVSFGLSHFVSSSILQNSRITHTKDIRTLSSCVCERRELFCFRLSRKIKLNYWVCSRYAWHTDIE